MADPTAQLLVKIEADTKGLKTGLDTAGRGVGGFAGTIRKHNKAIGLAMTAMGAAILATAVLSVKAFASMGDEVQKMALRTGFSTEALSELRHAAELSGTSLAGLEKASRTLSGTILDAGFGLESYTRAFDKIGVSYIDLAKVSPEEQFMIVLEALAGLTNESERAALAADLFGRAGTALLPMLVDGAEGLAAMRQEAHDLGIVFDQEAANKAAVFNDALTTVKGAVTGLQMKIAEILIPILLKVIERIEEVVVGLGKWAEEHKALTKIMVFLTTALGGLLLTLGPLIIMLDSLIDVWLAISVVWKSHVIPVIGRLIIALKAKIAALLASKIAIALHIPVIWGLITALWAQVTATLAAVAATGYGIPIAIAAAIAIGTLATGIWLLVDSQKEQYESTNAVIDAITRASESTGLYNKGLKETTESTKKLEKASTKLADSLRGTVAAAFMTYAAMGVMTATQFQQQKLLGRRLGIPGLAEGGIVTSPTLALVGEKGPEAIVPLDKMGGGITINFNEPVFMEKEESINKLADRINRVIQRNQRLSFGGAYSG